MVYITRRKIFCGYIQIIDQKYLVILFDIVWKDFKGKAVTIVVRLCGPAPWL